MPSVGAETGHRPATDGPMGTVVRALQWGLDRMLSVGYGVVYDAIFERFRPYQDLQAEVLELVEKGAPPDAARRDVHVLDVGCGPGNFTFVLAEAGFSAIGLEAYAALVGQYDRKLALQSLPKLSIAAESSPTIISGMSSWGKLFLSQNEDTELNKHLPVARGRAHRTAPVGGRHAARCAVVAPSVHAKRRPGLRHDPAKLCWPPRVLVMPRSF